MKDGLFCIMRIRYRLLVFCVFCVLVFEVLIFTLIGYQEQEQVFAKATVQFVRNLDGSHENMTQKCIYTKSDNDADFKPQKMKKTCKTINIFAHYFVHFKNMVINPQKAKRKIGGENLSQVLGQTEHEEDLNLQPGYFSTDCEHVVLDNQYYANIPEPALSWLTAAILEPNRSATYLAAETVFTIAVKRVEYGNLYHAMSEWYNVFLVAYMFQKTHNCTIKILFLDGHPWSNLDLTWTTLFGTFVRASFIEQPTLYQNIIWSIPGNRSPMTDFKANRLPMMETFRTFFLRQHNITSSIERNCPTLNVLFIWRRDYIAHPRNAQGNITRKIKNELELIENLKTAFPNYNIRGLQLDTLSMKKQLLTITQTDILIGMHGAGLTHILFLPNGSGVIELFPKNMDSSNRHFKTLAKWRDLSYHSWRIVENWHDFPSEGSTYVSPSVLKHMIRWTKAKICPFTRP